MELLYTEFIYPIKHYFSTIKRNELVFDILLPLIVAIISGYAILKNQCTITPTNASELFKTIIMLLSIFIGFTIASITILMTTRDDRLKKNIKRIKNTQINVYQLMNISFIFVLISEITTLIFNLVCVLLLSYKITLFYKYLNMATFINIFLLSHIFLLNIRNITNFYFIMFVLNKDELQNNVP